MHAALSFSLFALSLEYFEVFRTLCLVNDVYVGHKLFSHLNKNRVHFVNWRVKLFHSLSVETVLSLFFSQIPRILLSWDTPIDW